MSSSDRRHSAEPAGEGLDPGSLTDAELKARFAAMVREVAARMQEDDQFRAFPSNAPITVNDVMLTVTDMLHCVDVQVFELSMWQAFTGHTAPRGTRRANCEEEVGEP